MIRTYLSLDEKPEKKAVSVLMVVFGALCLFTAGWWAVFMIKVPENDNIFWAGTTFLFLFGIYQIYAGLGYARRYIKIDDKDIIIRQNSFFSPTSFSAPMISSIIIRSMDIIFELETGKRQKLKLGLRYPDLGENIKKAIIDYAALHGIEVFYKYDGIDQNKS